jgi:hypothetical protein
MAKSWASGFLDVRSGVEFRDRHGSSKDHGGREYRPFRRRTLPPEIPGGEGIYLFDELMRGTDLPDMHIGGERNPVLLRYCWRCLRRMAHPQSCHARLQYGRSSGFPKREGRRRCQSRQHPPTWLIGPRLAKHPGLPSQHQRSSPDHPACAQVK